ncbi:hypothetical protein [Neptunomonas japonica]|nr:hypothetical protein [Neptunomonas japonica]
MTTALFNIDSYQTQASAVVTAVTENHLELDQCNRLLEQALYVW